MKTIAAKIILALVAGVLLAANAVAMPDLSSGEFAPRDSIMLASKLADLPDVKLPSYQEQANLYTFVLNNPVNFIDPLGLQIDGAATPGIDEALMSPEQLQASRQAAQKAEQALQNKLNHIFDNPKHKLDACVKEFGGDKKKALNAIQDALKQQNLPNNQLFQTTVKVGNNIVTVVGKTINGAPSIGTAYVP